MGHCNGLVKLSDDTACELSIISPSQAAPLLSCPASLTGFVGKTFQPFLTYSPWESLDASPKQSILRLPCSPLQYGAGDTCLPLHVRIK